MRKCKLVPVSLSNNGWKGAGNLELQHGVPLKLGRNSLTNIKDAFCSRTQTIVVADNIKGTVKVSNVGSNFAAMNGFAVKENSEFELTHGSIIEIMIGEYGYQIIFEREDEPPEEEPPMKRARVQERPANNDFAVEKIDDGRLIVVLFPGVKPSKKIAGYDLDGTLITTKSGNRFPKNLDDWQISFPGVPGKLKTLIKEGYKICIFTNQAGLGKDAKKIKEFIEKVKNIVRRLGVPVQAYIATDRSKFRKPSTGMWEAMALKYNDGYPIDLAESFYCGDAAGRDKDHSFADIFFAENLAIKFFTPEEHFNNKRLTAPYKTPSFHPKNIDVNHKNPDIVIPDQEILVMVGFPACGKSTYSHRISIQSNKKYAIVCQDSIGAVAKCISEATKLLKAKRSVIVDSTNVTPEARTKWIALARSLQIKCRCAYFDMTIHHCMHNNIYRTLVTKSNKFIPDHIYAKFQKDFKEPQLAEGFDEILKLKFVPVFRDQLWEKKYFLNYLEK